METRKCHERRLASGFYDKYCGGRGIDIGAGNDPLQNAEPYDKEQGDAHTLTGVPDETFDYVYSSHCLEHLEQPEVALLNWWRVLKPGGYLIISVPHRDLYEKKKELPSRWNPDHKHFWLPYDNDGHTRGLREFIDNTLDVTWVSLEVQNTVTITDPYMHSDGEYSIEAILQKC